MFADVPTFIEKLVKSLDILRPRSFISRNQSQYLNNLKENIDESSAIFLCDFAENYSFVVQDDVHSFHWIHMMCTLHPVVVYYNDGGLLSHLSYAIISDDRFCIQSS